MRIRHFYSCQEECAPGGCFMELFVQMVIIFGGNQFIQQIMEFYMPLFWKCKHPLPYYFIV